jgi:hypothetical protein
MPVNTPCKLYNEKSLQWKIVRDVLEGEIVIKQEKEAYLPKPSGQNDDDYTRYIGRTHFFDATGRTAEGLHGSIFSKDPIQNGEVSDSFKVLLENVDGEGTSIDQFAADITWDAMQTCWGGILVDYPDVPVNTPQAAVKGGAYLKWYNAESVINWRYGIREGKRILALVVLREDEITTKTEDEFIEVSTERYRVLKLDERGYYIQRIYVKNSEGRFDVSPEPIEPKIREKNLTAIPFFPAPGKTPEKSMLLGLAFENIGHYQKTADYENGLHYAGTPTPVCENMNGPKEKLENGREVPQDVKLGGSNIIFFKDDALTPLSVNVKYLEFVGQGMAQILESLNSCEERMAILGARIISVEKKGVETAEAAKIHRAGENGVLGAFARNMSEVITLAVRVMMEWNGFTPEECAGWAYELNTDYDLLQAGAQIVSAILGAVANGTAPQIAGYNVLKKAGLLMEGMAYEKYLIELEAGGSGTHGPDGNEGEITGEDNV